MKINLSSAELLEVISTMKAGNFAGEFYSGMPDDLRLDKRNEWTRKQSAYASALEKLKKAYYKN